MSSRQQSLSKLIQPVIEALGCQLWGVDFSSQGRRSLLRIYIDKAGGVSLDDCEKVSRQISSLLDVEDPIAGHYTLEVSSPGMDRPLYHLEQFQQYIGQQVSIKLIRGFEGRKNFSGQLTAVKNSEVVIQVGDEQHVLGITPQNINHLTKLEQPLTSEATSDTFKEKLSGFMQKQSQRQEE